jgi:hypothetical protein
VDDPRPDRLSQVARSLQVGGLLIPQIGCRENAPIEKVGVLNAIGKDGF